MHKIKEDAPANSMGSSSSTAGTGGVDTFDPVMKTKKLRLITRKKTLGDIKNATR